MLFGFATMLFGVCNPEHTNKKLFETAAVANGSYHLFENKDIVNKKQELPAAPVFLFTAND